MKEIKHQKKKKKMEQHTVFGILNTINMSILPKLTHTFSAIPIKARLFVDKHKIILKLTWKD